MGPYWIPKDQIKWIYIYFSVVPKFIDQYWEVFSNISPGNRSLRGYPLIRLLLSREKNPEDLLHDSGFWSQPTSSKHWMWTYRKYNIGSIFKPYVVIKYGTNLPTLADVFPLGPVAVILPRANEQPPEKGNTGTFLVSVFLSFLAFLSNWRFKSNLHCVVHEHGNSHGSNTTRHWGQMAGNFHHLKTSHCVFVSICVFIWLLPPTHCDGHDWTGHLIVVHVSHEPLTRLFCRVRDGVDSWRSGLDTKQTERWKKRKELVFAALFAFN